MRTRRDGKLVDDDWGEEVPPVQFEVPWNHEPVGPYRLQSFHESRDPRMMGVETHTHFATVMSRFVGFFVPPLATYGALVIDEGFNVVMGVCATHHVLSRTNGQEGWYGVRRAYEWLEACDIDPLMLAVWEGQAMDSATGVEL